MVSDGVKEQHLVSSRKCRPGIITTLHFAPEGVRLICGLLTNYLLSDWKWCVKVDVGFRGLVVALWGKCAMWEDGSSPACCGFSLLHGCCWGRNRRVQPEVCWEAVEAKIEELFLY